MAQTDRELLIAARTGRRTFAGDVIASVALTNVATNRSLGSVVVPANPIPPGATITRVIAAIQWRNQVDSSAALNAVDGAQVIQVRNSVGGTFRNAIDIPDGAFETVASAVEGGVFLLGDNDLSIEVTGAATYDFQWTLALVDGASLTLHDVQGILIIDYA